MKNPFKRDTRTNHVVYYNERYTRCGEVVEDGAPEKTDSALPMCLDCSVLAADDYNDLLSKYNEMYEIALDLDGRMHDLATALKDLTAQNNVTAGLLNDTVLSHNKTADKIEAINEIFARPGPGRGKGEMLHAEETDR